MRPRGFSLLELILVMAIAAVVGIALVSFTRTTVQAQRTQSELAELEQSTAVTVQLLQRDLRLAGYRGGEGAEFTGAWSDPERAAALRWLAPVTDSKGNIALDNWQQFRGPSYASSGVIGPIQSLEGTLTESSSQADSIRITRVGQIVGSSGSGRICLERIGYSINPSDPAGPTLRRDVDSMISPWQSFSTPANNLQFAYDSNNVCSLIRAYGTQHPAMSGVEDLQVFFQDQAGNWSKNLPSTPAQLKAMGIYIRTRSPSPSGPSNCGVWPKTAVPDTPANLGIPGKTYTGASCRYRRIERFVPVYLSSAQQY